MVVEVNGRLGDVDEAIHSLIPQSTSDELFMFFPSAFKVHQREQTVSTSHIIRYWDGMEKRNKPQLTRKPHGTNKDRVFGVLGLTDSDTPFYRSRIHDIQDLFSSLTLKIQSVPVAGLTGLDLTGGGERGRSLGSARSTERNLDMIRAGTRPKIPAL